MAVTAKFHPSSSNKIKTGCNRCSCVAREYFFSRQDPFPVETLEMDLIAFRRAATCDVKKNEAPVFFIGEPAP